MQSFRCVFDLSTKLNSCQVKYDFSAKGGALLGVYANGGYRPDNANHAMLITWYVKDMALVEALEGMVDTSKLERASSAEAPVVEHNNETAYGIRLHFDPTHPDQLRSKIVECMEMLKQRGLIGDDISLEQECLSRPM